MLSKPFSVVTEDIRYGEALGKVFDNTFRKKIKSLGIGAVKSGIAYIQPYFDDGKMKFMRMPSTEIVPLWKDAERSEMDAFIRFYDQIIYEGTAKPRSPAQSFGFPAGSSTLSKTIGAPRRLRLTEATEPKRTTGPSRIS